MNGAYFFIYLIIIFLDRLIILKNYIKNKCVVAIYNAFTYPRA